MSRPRFSLRWMMVAVALVAIGLGGWRLMKLRESYWERVMVHGALAGFWSSERGSLKDEVEHYTRLIEIKRAYDLDTLIQDHKKAIDSARERLARSTYEHGRHTRLKLKYERLASCPWLSVEPDPTEPE